MNYQTFTLGTHTQTSQESYPPRCGFSARTSGLLREIGWMALGKLGGCMAPMFHGLVVVVVVVVVANQLQMNLN